MQNIKKHLSVLIVACVVLVVTLFIPTTVYTVEQERNILLGYPFPFVVQNSPYDKVEVFSKPAKYIVSTQRETPTVVLTVNLFSSLMFIFLGLEFVLYFVARLQSNQRLNRYIGPLLVASGVFFSIFIVLEIGLVLVTIGVLTFFLLRNK